MSDPRPSLKRNPAYSEEQLERALRHVELVAREPYFIDHRSMGSRRRWIVWCWLGLCAGCGRLAFDAGSSPSDARDDAASDEAAIDGPAVLPCLGTTHSLTDNFDDGVTSSTWAPFAEPGVSHAEQGGALEITLATDQAGSSWGGYVTSSSYDLRDDRIFAEVLMIPNPVQNGQSLLGARINTDTYVSIETEAGEILAARSIDDTWVRLDTTPTSYDPVGHRFWQLRERAGVLYWETSPDGATWNVLHSEPPGVDLSSVRITLTGGTNFAQSDPGGVRFDDLNGGGAPPACF